MKPPKQEITIRHNIECYNCGIRYNLAVKKCPRCQTKNEDIQRYTDNIK